MRLAKILAAAVLALVCTCSACSTRDDVSAARKTKDDNARELYARNCATCHGPEGEGKQVGTLRVPPLREGRAAQDQEAGVLSQIHHGGHYIACFNFTT